MLTPLERSKSQIDDGRTLEEVDEALRRTGVATAQREEILRLVHAQYWSNVRHEATTQLVIGLIPMALGFASITYLVPQFNSPRLLVFSAIPIAFGGWSTIGGVIDLVKYVLRSR